MLPDIFTFDFHSLYSRSYKVSVETITMFCESELGIKCPHTSDLNILDEQNITNTKHWLETSSQLRSRGQTRNGNNSRTKRWRTMCNNYYMRINDAVTWEPRPPPLDSVLWLDRERPVLVDNSLLSMIAGPFVVPLPWWLSTRPTIAAVRIGLVRYLYMYFQRI